MVQFALGWFANPILIDGKYPAIMREKIDSKSSAQGFSESRLPMFSPEQSQMVANSSGLAKNNIFMKHMSSFTYFWSVYAYADIILIFKNKTKIFYCIWKDFLGINFYTSELVYPLDEGFDEVSYYKDDDVELYQDPSWFTSGSSGKAVTPWGLRSLMSWIKSHYPGVDVYITENGFSDKVTFQNLPT